ncbi:MAG: leucine-rich repeat domain-containing protein [Proteobacteria bacterium]|nr:MAG: leucine-rich repeat domain-containing protein [Pseudomonadota bacterium]
MSNRFDELQLICGISQNEIIKSDFWIFNPEIDGNAVEPKELELYRLSKDGSTNSEGLGFTSKGCIKVQKQSNGDTLIVNRPSTSNPAGFRLILPDTEQNELRPLIVPISLKPYDNKNFDIWSQCGDVPGKESKDGIYFKIIDRTLAFQEFQTLSITLNQNASPAFTPVSKSGCFFLNQELDGTIGINDPLNTVYGELIIPNKRVQNVLYPIYIGPAPTDQENCLKRNLRWKWSGNECQLKTFTDFCTMDRTNTELSEAFRILFENFSRSECLALDQSLRDMKELTIFQRKNLPNIYLLQDFNHFQTLNISQNKIVDITPIRQMDKLKELYLQSNNLSSLNGLPKGAPLEVLAFWDNNLQSIKGVENFPKVRELYAQTNQIETIEPLEKLTDLKMLYLSDNRVEDISVLSRLKNLEELYMAYNKLSKLEPLKELTKIKKLTLSFNQITDISPLEGLTNMEVLYLWGNKVSDLAPLSKMLNLQTVYLSANRINDISVFNSIQTLDLFYAPDNAIYDIRPLSNQKKIRYINLNNNPILDISPLKDLENIIELKMVGTSLDSLTKTTNDKCPIEAKSPVVQNYCKKKVVNP